MEPTGSRADRHRSRARAPRAGLGAAGSGWALAALWAGGAAALGLLVAGVLVAGASAASPAASPSPGVAARVGALLFLWFHHVGVVFETASGAPGQEFGFTLRLALLGATAVVLGVLVLGGARVAGRGLDGGTASGLRAAASGGRVGVPYAGLCAAVALGCRFTVDLPPGPLAAGPVRIHPSLLSAVLWPLALGVAAGAAGGLRASRGRALPEGALERRIRGAVAGGFRSALVAVGLSFAGLLILAVVHPGDTRSYFDAAFRRGAMPGTVVVGLTALLTPNLAAWVLFPSMGACLTLTGTASQCLLSYGRFPGPGAGGGLGGLVGSLAPATQTNAPLPYLLFLLIPAAATVLGGMRAAAIGRATSRGEAALLGAAGGAVFAVLCAGLVLLGSISGSVGRGLGRPAGSAFHLGPDPVPSMLLALAWGILGGAVGAALRGGPDQRSVSGP